MAGGDGDDDEVRVINTGDTATVKAHLDDTLVRVRGSMRALVSLWMDGRLVMS